MTTLIVQYTPRNERSNTKKILDAARTAIPEGEEVEVLDLCKTYPDFFLPENLAAYYKRNYNGEELTQEEAQMLTGMDAMVEQIKRADNVILAFPMYNFGMPGIVKCWVDMVVINKETWYLDETGFHGKLKGNGLVIVTAGGAYSEGEMVAYNHASTHATQVLGFMGLQPQAVMAEGLLMPGADAQGIVTKAQEAAKAIVESWF